MPQSHHIQHSFTGGEISRRMLMRTDTEVYARSALLMQNYFPTPMGSAVRVPGPSFLRDIGGLDARIVPYLTAANERSLVLFTPLAAKLLTNVDEIPTHIAGANAVSANAATVIYRRNIIENWFFQNGFDGWNYAPNEYYSSNGDGPLGVVYYPDSTTVRLLPRIHKSGDIDTCTLETTAEVDYATDAVTLEHRIVYELNPPAGVGGYTFQILISPNADYSSPIYDKTYDEESHPVGSRLGGEPLSIALPAVGWTGTLYIKLEAKATLVSDRPKGSGPQFAMSHIRLYANAETTLVETDLVTPYSAEDLQDLHYIQSPYDDKELVVTHPKHPPYRLYFDTGGGQYVFEIIPFTGETAPVWSVNNYPATCGSYHGRLVLAGGQTFKVAPGDPVANVSETVWCTKVGDWDAFSDQDEVDPDDSIEFTAIYRSPIQWVYGQKTLLVGALEYEYSASGEGIYSPGDLGVFLHSTHGSNNVQPAGFGESVLFSSDGGRRIRATRYQQDDEGWVAEDLTLLNPEIAEVGVVRMVRVRTPRQMCWAVLKTGEIAVWHSESGLQGWSRYTLTAGSAKDICVLPDGEGQDVPYLLVQRNIDGAEVLYLEAVTNLYRLNEERPHFMESHKVYDFETPTNVITGLEHLEGRGVQVATQTKYLGIHVVSGGQITLTDELSNPINVTQVFIGMQQRAVINTVPPAKQDPKAPIRYSSFGVRVLGSMIPAINRERPKMRTPEMQVGASPDLEVIYDAEVPIRGWDPYQSIRIHEQLPYRSEILGVYGKLKEGTI